MMIKAMEGIRNFLPFHFCQPMKLVPWIYVYVVFELVFPIIIRLCEQFIKLFLQQVNYLFHGMRGIFRSIM